MNRRPDRPPTGPRINFRIRAREIRVIDADGAMLGVMTPDEAMRIAQEKGLDLVEISPEALPPVCKILDFGKFKYETKKKTNDAKKKQVVVTVKEVKFRPKIDDHDFDFKCRNLKGFIEDGHKAKVTLMYRGREITHPELGRAIMDKVKLFVADVAQIESEPRFEGRNMIMLLAPKPQVMQELRRRDAEKAKEQTTKDKGRPETPGPDAAPAKADGDDQQKGPAAQAA